jgi:hypothetical protein
VPQPQQNSSLDNTTAASKQQLRRENRCPFMIY